jgi:eukaryotic-like serine/threonine-protein kinase
MVASAGSRSGRAPVLAKYDVLDELGHGGMATVYRAHDHRLSRDVAIKVLHPHLRESREIAHRFSVEAKAVAKLRHPNIVEVFDVSSDEDTEQYLVVELVRGPTLRKILQERGALPAEIGAAIVLELLSGIGHAHASGVVHRDVKPENVLIEHRPKSGPTSARDVNAPSAVDRKTPTPSTPAASANPGERVAVKLTDFGIAKLLDAQGVTSTGQVLGSPAHMAPEQIEGGDVDGRADVFGLGVLLYECLVGHLPFLGNNPAQVLRRVLDGVYASAERERPTVGKVWSQILDHALARKPEGRYPDAAAMRDAIAAELSRLGMGAPRVELEAWFDDPEGWTAAHEKRLIGRLCALADVARKKSDAVAAAADYNRALAYAPNDPSLLKVVARMQRSEARMRLLRRVGPLVLGAAFLGSGAYFIAKALKAPHDDPREGAITILPPGSIERPASSLTARPIPSIRPTDTATSATTSPLTTRTIAVPTIVPSAGKAVQRVVTFGALRPAFGVRMTIDGVPAPDPDAHKSFTLDEKAHRLVFSCAGDLCTPRTVDIPAGEKEEILSVELAIAPARLIVEGDPSHSYGLEEFPQITVSTGQETEVPLTSGNKVVTVFDRSDASKKQSVSLKAGRLETVTFKAR